MESLLDEVAGMLVFISLGIVCLIVVGAALFSIGWLFTIVWGRVLLGFLFLAAVVWAWHRTLRGNL